MGDEDEDEDGKRRLQDERWRMADKKRNMKEGGGRMTEGGGWRKKGEEQRGRGIMHHPKLTPSIALAIQKMNSNECSLCSDFHSLKS